MTQDTQQSAEQAAQVVQTFVGDIPAGEISQMLASLYDKLGALVDKHGEVVYDSIMAIIQIHAGYSLLLAIVCSIIALWVTYRGWLCFRKLTKEKQWEDVWEDGWPTVLFLRGCALVSIGGMVAFAWISKLFNLYYWMALINPEWGLAFKVIVKALSL